MDKTEKQKMLAGELYRASDSELVAARQSARRLTRLYNSTTEEEIEQRMREAHATRSHRVVAGGNPCRIIRELV
jgi:hypothetical protein